ncbi:MAG: hypothetical protein ACSHXJ_16815 [Marinomonas colpomeniae]
MLFQTYYRLDPWCFEPPLEDFDVIQVDDSKRMFSLFMCYERSFNEEVESKILIQTIYHKKVVPDSVEDVLTGKIDIEFDFDAPDFGISTCLPDDYREFIVTLHKDIDRIASEVFNIIRWRMGIVGGPLVLQSEWSFMRWHDEKIEGEVLNSGFLNRQILTGGHMIGLPEMQKIDMGKKCEASIESLIQLQSNQPLYHDLFREAWQSQLNNPRSALVMGIAAAETGFKTTLADLNPSVSWIIENLSSPSLILMLREYMEQLPTRNLINGKVLRPPNSVINTIRKGVELRNKLVHGREEAVTAEEVRLMLEAVRDLLYMLDYYRGHDWAMDRLSPEILEYLKSKKDN